MYFKIKSKSNDDDLSWILCKDPNNNDGFERTPKSGVQCVKGNFVDGNPNEYELKITPNPLKFIKTAREKNLPAYIHPELGAATISALDGISDALRSAIRGSNATGGQLTDEQVLAEKDLEIVIGPYFSRNDTVVETYENVGITAIPQDDNTSTVFMYKLIPHEKLSVSRFLQKVYITSFYLSRRSSLYRLEKSKVEKFILFSKGWLRQSEFKNRIINGILKFHKGYIKLFEKELMIIDGYSEEDIVAKMDNLEERLEYEGLGVKRINKVTELVIATSPEKVVDLCCGEGRLLRNIIDTMGVEGKQYLGIDADFKKLRRLSKHSHTSKIQYSCCNVLEPKVFHNFIRCDVVTCTEGIEHFDERSRMRLLRIIRTVYAPKTIIITTPNLEYNSISGYDLMENGYRHPDHKIEYTKELFESEVCDYLKKDYECEFVNITDEDIQPTIVLVATHRRPGKRYVSKKTINLLEDQHSSLYLPTTATNVSANSITSGMVSRSVMNNKRLFYIAPTIAPVEYNKDYPDYLEHPVSAISYFKDRGITQLICEQKYMGCRAYMLVFKSPEIAKSMGYDKPIIINSRNGVQFFYEDPSIEDKLYEELQPKLRDDNSFIMLDCEITPWCILGKRLIKKEFKIPGECVYLSRKYCNDERFEDSQKFLSVLDIYSKDSDLQVYPFSVLAEGIVNTDTMHYRIEQSGYFTTHIDQLTRIKQLAGKYFKPCNWFEFVVGETPETELINKWLSLCASGSEGLVIKPNNPLNYTQDGYAAQQSLKVRGRDYLRIVYGVDYLDEEIFNIVKLRNVKTKRMQAARQNELSQMMLRSFLRKQDFYFRKIAGAFVGMETMYGSKVDATL